MNAELTMDIAGRPSSAMRVPPHAHTGTEQAVASVAAEVFAALEAKQLDLPTLPEVARKILDMIDDVNVSADEVVNLISACPAISMHIIRAANSAPFIKGDLAGSLRSAISNLGYRSLRNMVMNITTNKQIQAQCPLIKQQLKRLWDHSREVAAISYVLACQQKHLKPEQAMLAGMVHDIGALPLYLYADHHYSRFDQAMLAELIRRFSVSVGVSLLKNWNFPDTLVEVVEGHENMRRASPYNLADYADVVTMASLQIQGAAKYVAWRNVLAAERLGYYPEDCQNFLSNHANQLAQARSMLHVDLTGMASSHH
ncbi:MAG: HDOD domain-containing protein [Gallionella sp.]|nr:HDOD domain-containing protein [Gallionella sp.]